MIRGFRKISKAVAISAFLFFVGSIVYGGTTIIGVRKTGQVTTSAAGDDGALKKGFAWPTPRFKDNGDGTVSDNMTGLMWIKNGQQITGEKKWDAALAACNNLTYANYKDWRMPNILELQSLIDYGKYNPALPEKHPFTNVVSDIYWSSTTAPSSAKHAFYISLNSGVLSFVGKDCYYSVWPVRGPQ